MLLNFCDKNTNTKVTFLHFYKNLLVSEQKST